jgi:hypothetical protein
MINNRAWEAIGENKKMSAEGVFVITNCRSINYYIKINKPDYNGNIIHAKILRVV